MWGGPEGTLLLLCARPNADGARVRAIAAQVSDWQRVLDSAERCGVGPVLYANLRTCEPGLVPPVVLQQLQAGYFWVTVRNEDLFSRLGAVLRGLTQRGIRAVVLKGAALAELVYPDRALRPMSDLDLMVAKDDLSVADDALLSMGYVHTSEIHSAGWYRAHHHHLNPHISADRQCVIELHHQVAVPSSPMQLPSADLWGRVHAVRVASVATHVLAADDLLLHLSIHFWTHVGDIPTLRTLGDISATIEHTGDQLDWDRLRTSARSYQLIKPLYWMLVFAQTLQGTTIPTHAMRALETDARPGRLDRRILEAVALRALVGGTSRLAPGWFQQASGREWVGSHPIWRKAWSVGLEVVRHGGLAARRRLERKAGLA